MMKVEHCDAFSKIDWQHFVTWSTFLRESRDRLLGISVF